MESENQALSQLSSGLVETWSSDHMKRPSSCIGHAILDNIGGIWDGHSMYWDSRWFCSFVIRESFCWVMGCGIIPLQADDLIYLILESDLGHGHHVFLLLNQLGSSSQDGIFEESANVFVLKLKVYKPFLDIPLRKRVVKKKWASDWSIRFCITDLLEKLHKVEFQQWWNFSNPPAINMFIPFAHQFGSILITIYITMNMVGIQILNKSWLVVWNMNLLFHSVGNVIIPTDELICFRGVGIPPTSVIIFMLG